MSKDIEILSRELASRPDFLAFVGKLAVAQARADARLVIETTGQVRDAVLTSQKNRWARRQKDRSK